MIWTFCCSEEKNMPIKLANNASGTLATAINSTDTGLILTTGDGAEFPALAAGEYFYLTLTAPSGAFEIVKATARVGDAMTVVRAQEGTTAIGFPVGSRAELKVTAQSVEDLVNDYDDALRANLAASSGSSLVGFLPSGTSAVATTVQAKLRETVSVKDFGAVGDDNQNLTATNYTVNAVTITQQTDDAIAINKAIVYLRSIGGGALYFPRGTYRIYGYLETIDFPVHIFGDGIDSTILKNCDASPTNTNGYGILFVNPASLSAITVEHMTLDGNATVRAQPTFEIRAYPIAFYGQVNGRVNCIKSINSPIDCFYTGYANSVTNSMQVTNCVFSNSYRNTVSNVSGWNQQYTNCIIEGGGTVYTGTNPKYCIDIEPDSALSTIKNITYTNCLIQNAVNVLAGGIWAGNVLFNGCTFNDGAAGPFYMAWFRGGEFTLNNCLFDHSGYNGVINLDNPTTGEFANSQFVSMTGCVCQGVGVRGYQSHMIFQSNTFTNSKQAFILRGTGTPQNIIVRNLNLINVFDIENFGSGRYSSFQITSEADGYIDIDGLQIRIEPAMLPGSGFTTGVAYGIYLDPTLANVEAKVSNVQIAGFYQKYPIATSQALNPSFFRDWGSPGLPPANTAGQTAGPGSIYYANCTMYGNSA
jgi:hypothetical protein